MKLLLILFFTFSSYAKDWRINDQHTQVQFNIGYMGVMEVAGLFSQTRGKFEYDAETLIARNILFQIATKSIQTHNKKRDAHLRRSDFFDVARFPWIEILIPQVKLAPGQASTLAEVTLRGVTKKIPVKLHIEGLKPDPWDEGKYSLFLRVIGTINRSDFGLTWNKKLDQGGVLVSDQVGFSVDIEANPSDQKLAFSRFYLPQGVVKSQNQISPDQLPKDIVFEVESESDKAPIKLSPKDSSNTASVIIGFLLFSLITIASIALKIKLQKYMEVKFEWGNTKSEIVSDLILLAFVMSTFMATAPLMGYGN